MSDSRHMIAKNIAVMLNDGDFVNLGVGMPTLVSSYIPKEITVLLHGENGCIGQQDIITDTPEKMEQWMNENGGESGNWKKGHRDLGNAGNDYVTLIPGGSCFDSSISFAMARGGHLDTTVLGGLQVDKEGNLANWIVPGKRISGMGGAMDLVNGAKKVIVAMEHCSKQGEPKLVNKCTLPLTALHCVDTVVTELCVLNRYNNGFMVIAMAPGLTQQQLQEKTELTLTFSKDIQEMLTV